MNDISQTMNDQEIFSKNRNQNQWGIIQNSITMRTLVATQLNNVKALDEVIEKAKGQEGQQAFGTINQLFQFEMFKTLRRKIIFNKVIARVVPEPIRGQNNSYNQEIEFDIQPDNCCVSNLTFMHTTDIKVVDYTKLRGGKININGYGAADYDNGLEIPVSQVECIKIAYPPNFMCNYINMIYFCVKTTGGNSLQVQQKFPIEIAYLFFKVISEAGLGITYQRWLREDVFVIGHRPYKQDGQYAYQLMKTPKGNSEIGKYYIEDKIQDIFSNNMTYLPNANPSNITLSLQGPPVVSSMAESGVRFQFSNLLNYNLGHPDGSLDVTFSLDKFNKNFYTNTEGSYISLGENNKYIVSDDVAGAVCPMVVEVDGKLTSINPNGVPMSILANSKTQVKITGASPSFMSSTKGANDTYTVKFNTKAIPVFVTAFTTPEDQVSQLREIYAKCGQHIPKFKLEMNKIAIATGVETDDSNADIIDSSEMFAILPTISVQYGEENKYSSIQWNIFNIVNPLNRDGEMWKYPMCTDVVIKLIPKINDDVQYFSYKVNTSKGTVTEDVSEHASSFIVANGDNGKQLINIMSACNVYRMDDNRFSHEDGAKFKRAFCVDGKVGYETISQGERGIFKSLETNSPFVGGFTKQLRTQDKIQIDGSMATVTKITEKSYPQYLTELLREITGKAGASFGAASPFSNPGQGILMNIEVNPYHSSDFLLGSLYQYITSDGMVKKPDYVHDQDTLDMLKYNAAQLYNKDNAEFNPTIENVDYQSVHTFRIDHGTVDWFFSFPFAFFTEGGLENSYPMYATPSQQLVVKISFNDPLPLMQTCVVLKPEAVNNHDICRKARMFTNQLNNNIMLVSNYGNMKNVLFYNKYIWDARLTDILKSAGIYAWIIRSYDRNATIIDLNKQGGELCKLSKSVFYTRAYIFFVTTATVNYINNRGRSGMDGVSLVIDRYSLPIWEVLQYNVKARGGLTGYSGQDALDQFKNSNTVRNLVPIESIGVVAGDQRDAVEQQPFRFMQMNEYINAPHEKGAFHQPLLINNMVQISIDPKFYQTDMAQAYYCSANSPAYSVTYKAKMGQGMGNTQIGIDVIEEFMNVSAAEDGYVGSRWKQTSD